MAVVNDENMPDDLAKTYQDILGASDEKSESESVENETEEDDTDKSKEQEDEESTDDGESEEDSADDKEDEDGEDSGHDDGEENDGKESESGEEIPDWVVNAARSAGYNDRQIVDMANANYTKLVEMAFDLSKPAKETTEKPTKENQVDLPDDKELEGLDPKSKETVGKLTKVIHTLLAKEKERESKTKDEQIKAEEAQKNQHLQYVQAVDKVLDAIKIDALGNSQKLTDQHKATRNLVHDMAVALTNHKKIAFEDALRIAAKNVTGLTEKNAKDQLRKDLDKRKAKFTAKPGTRKAKSSHKSQEGATKEVVMGKMQEFGLDAHW